MSTPGSTSRIEDTFLAAYGFREGKLVRLEILALGSRDTREALKALGLTP